MLNPLDLDSLRRQFQTAQPFPHVIIDNFLAPGQAEQIAAAYPTFDKAQTQGVGFNVVNEQRKIQITDTNLFPEAVRRLSDTLASPDFLAKVEYITGIPSLLADDLLEGGGMHLTGPGGRLDVHVDFNVTEQRKLFRRLNILLYLNPVWREEWGGHIELWDADVKTCHFRAQPVINKCLIFATSEISYHGVTPIKCPPDVARRSFAAYYYTKEPPLHWDGQTHSTVFRARPDENLRRFLLMPAERLRREITQRLRRSKKWVMGRIGLS